MRALLLRTACILAVAAVSVGVCTSPADAAPHHAGGSHTLAADTVFARRTPDRAARAQVDALRRSGHHRAATLVADMINTPQATWFDRGSPNQVRRLVRQVVRRAEAKRTVPVLVVYDVPGRDCSQYSSGGAGSDAAYRAWIDAFVSGLGHAHAVTVVEPDGLANLPSDCPSAYPGQDVAALTAGRIADIAYAGRSIESKDPNSLVYLDAGHSAWHSAADMARRLDDAGVAGVQGFFLNVSNYQYTQNSEYYGTWLSQCLAYATNDNNAHRAVSAGDFAGCGDQYWNGGPANNWQGTAMTPYAVWSEQAADPAANPSGVDSRYAQELGTVQPLAHFVIDTSRNGTGPDDMSRYGTAPYNQPADVVAALRNGNWCNPPAASLGLKPKARPAAAFPLLDAWLWVKTPGQSDGQCDIAGGARAWDYSAYNPWGWSAADQQTHDPLWGLQDPAAGDWFPQQALALVRFDR